MDTSLINVDLHPNYIRMEIKGKVTQLKFEEEILVDKSKLQRSTTTGAMLLTMPKASISEVEALTGVDILDQNRTGLRAVALP